MTVQKAKAMASILPMLALTLFLFQAAPARGAIYFERWGSNGTTLAGFPRHTHWMGKLPNNMLISRLSIPGTHESMSIHPAYFTDFSTLGTKFFLSWLKVHVSFINLPECNSLPLMDQLLAGVRAIDIRLHYNADDHDPSTWMEIYHGYTNEQGEFVTDVLDKCRTFLKKHKSETIFVRVQETGGTFPPGFAPFWAWINVPFYKDFWSKFHKTIKSDSTIYSMIWKGHYADGWPRFSKVPTLGDVRGKIVILQQFRTSETVWPIVGLTYSNDVTVPQPPPAHAAWPSLPGLFDLQTGNYWTFDIPEIRERFGEFKQHMCDAASPINTKIVTTCFAGSHFSLNSAMATPGELALGTSSVHGMNQRLYRFLKNPPICLGMVYVDFPGPGLIKRIIDLNYVKPVITLIGKPEMVLQCGVDTFHDPGATVKDPYYPSLQVVVGGDKVDPRKPGVYIITYNATDPFGRKAAQVTRMVIVKDTLPPEFKSLSATPNLLWPPNHKLVQVNFQTNVVDLCDPNPSVVLTAISSSCAGHKNGDIEGAAIGAPDFSVLLRAEKCGKGDSRTYQVTYTATDHSGNWASKQTTVTVPHSKGR